MLGHPGCLGVLSSPGGCWGKVLRGGSHKRSGFTHALIPEGMVGLRRADRESAQAISSPAISSLTDSALFSNAGTASVSLNWKKKIKCHQPFYCMSEKSLSQWITTCLFWQSVVTIQHGVQMVFAFAFVFVSSRGLADKGISPVSSTPLSSCGACPSRPEIFSRNFLPATLKARCITSCS